VDETGIAEVLVGAVDEVEAVGAGGAGEAIEVGDAVEAGDVASAVGSIEYMEAGEVGGVVVALVVICAAVGVRNSIIATASVAEIFEVIQSLSLPWSNVRGSSGLRWSSVLAFLQSHWGSAHSNISVLSCSTIMPRSVTTLLI